MTLSGAKIAAAEIIRGQFRNDRRRFTLKRRAAGKIAGQFGCEEFRLRQGCGATSLRCRLLRRLPPPVPCRTADAFRKAKAVAQAVAVLCRAPCASVPTASGFSRGARRRSVLFCESREVPRIRLL
jgi:hypothetical protein